MIMDQQNPTEQVEQASPSKRIYMGNLPYHATATDVEQYLVEAGFQIERLDISVDPLSGRNPSYCFVELFSMEEAERALSLLPGASFMGRPLRVNVHTPKNRGPNSGNENGRSPRSSPFLTGDRAWRTQPPANGASKEGGREPYASNRWDKKDAPESPRSVPVKSGRLYVGGLPQLEDSETLEQDMRSVFGDYTVESVSKLLAPHESTSTLPGDHHYCFVDLATPEEAQTAATALHATPTPWGGKFKVDVARERPGRRVVKDQQQVSDKPAPVRDFGSSWRRAA